MRKLTVEEREQLQKQGCDSKMCMYFNTLDCLSCSKGELWRKLLSANVGKTNN